LLHNLWLSKFAIRKIDENKKRRRIRRAEMEIVYEESKIIKNES
jgi:hypothetical protein